MNYPELGALFLLGVLGTAHCVGMCGPLVLAIPGSSGRLAPHLAYHLGRVATYMLIGAVVGGIGAGISLVADGSAAPAVDQITRIQIAFSLFAALFLLAFGLVRIGLIPEPRWLSLASPEKIPGFGGALGRSVAEGGLTSTFALGLMMGFLPCGLSYAAFAAALPSGSPLSGALMVLAFGFGTIPGLLLVGTAASQIARRHRKLFDLLAGVTMIGLAVSMALDVLVIA